MKKNVTLQQQEKKLETHYKEANAEINNVFDSCILDGLEKNETW